MAETTAAQGAWMDAPKEFFARLGREELVGMNYGMGKGALGREVGKRNFQSPNPGLRFSVVRFPERRSEILALRRMAFGSNGEFAATARAGVESATAKEADPRDCRASVVIAELAGQIIGSVRLALPAPGPILHHTSQVSGTLRGLPSRSEYTEASRACIHPDHQRKGLFWPLAAHMLLFSLSFGRPYLVAGSNTQLWPKWQQCGFSKIGATYRTVNSDSEFFVLVLELKKVFAGRGVAPKLAQILSSWPG